jgi:hypothetical protein
MLLLLLAMFVGCCAGVLPFSGGDALIYGSSIKSEAGLDAVRPLMGVCPQFDVLWGELSGLEHLTIAGLIKGLPWNKVCRLPYLYVNAGVYTGLSRWGWPVQLVIATRHVMYFVCEGGVGEGV